MTTAERIAEAEAKLLSALMWRPDLLDSIQPQVRLTDFLSAEGRAVFRIYPHNILFPGFFLATTVLAVNMLGDGLRDMLDPRTRKQI